MTQFFLLVRRKFIPIIGLTALAMLTPLAGAWAVTINVSVHAWNPNGGPLSYMWRSPETVNGANAVVDQNSPSTTWTLPPGPGIHFAYVLVCLGSPTNGASSTCVSGGPGNLQVEGRIAVNTDNFGGSVVVPPALTLSAPALAYANPNLTKGTVSTTPINQFFNVLEYLGSYTPPNGLPTITAPIILSMSTSQLPDGSFGTYDPPALGFPSDVSPAPEAFFSYQGQDSSQSACYYYKAIGAVQDCKPAIVNDAAVEQFVKPISFEDWKRTVGIDSYATTTQYSAAFINRMDLNLARNHHLVSYNSSNTAAYVCNSPGPGFANAVQFANPTQPQIDQAISDAVNGKNTIACVAMDYKVNPGTNNNQPYTRFYIFGPSGELLPSINFDKRREKFLPTVCLTCHGSYSTGTDIYTSANSFSPFGNGQPNVGGSFLPYDTGNFLFSSNPSYNEAAQELSIYNLNKIVRSTAPNSAIAGLILTPPGSKPGSKATGWYANGTTLDKFYVPPSWQSQSTAAQSFYTTVIARSCRSCHVANSYDFDDYSTFSIWKSSICSYISPGANSIVMPNSLNTFNQLWLDPNQKAQIKSFLGCPTPSYTPRLAVASDFNGDGQTDIFWHYVTGNFTWWLSTGASFTSEAIGALTAGWQLATIGDFNGDGKSDIAWRNTNGDLVIWTSTGSTFTGQDLGIVPTSWQIQGAADFDGDGKADILWRNTNGDFSVWYSTGTSFSGLDFGIIGSQWQIQNAGAGDFDGDGKADILWRDNVGDVIIWNSTGHSFNGVVYSNPGTAWQVSAVGDFDGNGYSDIAWRNTSGEVVVWYSGKTGFSAKSFGVVPVSWHIQKAGDVTGDGRADLVWRNDNGDFTTWISTGSSFFGEGVIDIDTNWTIVGK